METNLEMTERRFWREIMDEDLGLELREREEEKEGNE